MATKQINLYAIKYKKRNGKTGIIRAYSTSMQQLLKRAKQKKVKVISAKRLQANVKSVKQKKPVKKTLVKNIPKKAKSTKSSLGSMISKSIKGRVFYSSWGYDQTNYDYFVVKEVSPTGKTAIVQRAKAKYMGTSGQSDVVKPTSVGYGKRFRVKVRYDPKPKYGDKITLRGSLPYSRDDSATHLVTIWLAEKGKVFYPTNSLYGH